MTNENLTREEVLWWYSPELRLRREAFRTYLERGEDWCKGGEYAFHNSISYTSFRKYGTGLSPIGDLPVLLYTWGSWRLHDIHDIDVAGLFSFGRHWRWSRTYLNDRSNWSDGRLKGFIEDANDPTLTPLDRVLWVLNDPRTVDLESIQETDDTVRIVRLIQTTYQRFVLDDEPMVPSLWKEEEQVLCGWNNLFPEDERCLEAHISAPFENVWEWYGARWWEPEKWRWRVPRTTA